MDIKGNANTNLRFLNAKSFMVHFTTNADKIQAVAWLKKNAQ